MKNKNKALAICSVPGCGKSAYVEVFLYDIYEDLQEVKFKQDLTCPYLCAGHMVENEREAYSPLDEGDDATRMQDIAEEFESGERRWMGAITSARRIGSGFTSVGDLLNLSLRRVPPIREPRSVVHYPFSNQQSAQGFTMYVPLPETSGGGRPG